MLVGNEILLFSSVNYLLINSAMFLYGFMPWSLTDFVISYCFKPVKCTSVNVYYTLLSSACVHDLSIHYP
jgi:hypothetical protein